MKVAGSRVTPDALKKLLLLGDKQGSISLKDLSHEMSLSTDETVTFLQEVFPDGNGAEIYLKDDVCMVDLNAHMLQYMLPLSPSEWLSLHALLKTQDSPSLASLKTKLIENGPIKAVMEILSHLDHWDLHLDLEHEEIVKTLDHAVDTKSMISITTHSKRSYQLFPCKIIHLEGKLSMIAEDANDHCLVVLAVDELKSVVSQETTTVSKVTIYEIDEFITAIRSMSEKETRLILKIHDPQSVNLFPNYHFLGKPCMITNPNGDLIWAAYVEPGDDLFEWLLSLGTNVEVLDPTKFKDEFLSYCEEKLRKVA